MSAHVEPSIRPRPDARGRPIPFTPEERRLRSEGIRRALEDANHPEGQKLFEGYD